MPPNSFYSIGFTCFWLGLLLFVLGAFLCSIKIAYFMGGDKNRIKPTCFENWKRNTEVWNDISDGGLMPYMERLKGISPRAIEEFVNVWDNCILKVHDTEFRIDEDFIAEITGM